MQKLIAFLYNSNEQLKTEMKKTRKEIIRHKSNKTCTSLYTENYKMLMKQINKDLDKWKDILCACIRSLKVVKKKCQFSPIWS